MTNAKTVSVLGQTTLSYNREFFEMIDRSCSDKIGNQTEWSAKGTWGAVPHKSTVSDKRRMLQRPLYPSIYS